jgi:uncharacterized sodium:solute symporter family permease YidK
VVLETFLGYPLLVAGYTLLVVTDRVPLPLWVPVAIALMGLSLVGAALTYGWAHPRTTSAARLDERQRAMLDRAYVIGYGVLAVVVSALSGTLAIVTSFDGPIVLTMEGLTPFLIALGLYLPILPLAILAWIEPDPVADDLDPGR